MEKAPEGVYVYQPHPVTREDGLLWSIGGLPSGMSRSIAEKIADAINRILNAPEASIGSGNQVSPTHSVATPQERSAEDLSSLSEATNDGQKE